MIIDLVDGIYDIVDKIVKKTSPDWRWMVVTSTDPLRIRFDEEENPLELTPDTLVSGLSVGNRVLVKVAPKQLPIIIGKSGG